MKNSTIIRVVIFGALTVIGIVAIQAYLLVKTWDIKEQEFHEDVRIALQNVAEEFEELGSQLPTYDIINQLSSNYYVVNVNDVINANNLDYFLRKELESVGLNDDFEYGIYDCATNQMVYGNYVSYENEVDPAAIKKEDLPIYDKFTYYFGVRFPNRAGQIFSNLGTTILLSSILFLTIVFFMYTTMIILRQKRLSEMQKDFINNMTHEFKTPISTIKISSDVFLNHPVIKQDKRLHQYANIIKDQNQRLNNQVEKVLQLARIEKDNFKLHKETCDLHELLNQTLTSSRMKVEELGGQLTAQLNATQPMLKADKLHLTNILHNLVDNAIKYKKDKPDITVSTANVGKRLVFTIADQGIGIAKEYQTKIFEKFYRVPTGNVHDVKGFGLGLFYIKNICEGHGWKLEVESEEGAGTQFSITI